MNTQQSTAITQQTKILITYTISLAQTRTFCHLFMISLHKGALDLVIIYADPRRMTDEFKIILNQFNRLPLISLKVASCAINCDDINDHRKYVKKNKLSCVLLSDPSRKVKKQEKTLPISYLMISPSNTK